MAFTLIGSAVFIIMGLIRLNARFGVPPGVLSADILPMTGEELALLLLAQRRARRPELAEAPGMPR